MKIHNMALKIALLIVPLSLSQVLSAQVNSDEEAPSDSILKRDAEINLVFDQVSAKRTSGSVNYIDVQSELMRDGRADLGSLIDGKVPGVFGAYNIWGTGNAVVVVDGIWTDSYYYESMSMMEVESIVVLKDAVSKALYGAQGDQGVILVTTKRGKPGVQKINVRGEYTMSQPRALPNYLDAATYMEVYNEAQRNDGIDELSLRYAQEVIDATREGSNPTRYPDNEFYTDEYLRNFTSNVNVFADVMGGDQNAQYYVSTEWRQSNGWLNTDIPDKTNRFNFNGNLDFRINKYIKMGVNASARLRLNNRPRANYWNDFSSVLPNAYPILWDPEILQSEAARELLLTEANLENGQVLGGSSSFANNHIYGDLVQNGRVRYMQRNVQFGGLLDVDLSFITEGLSAKGYAGMKFYNSLLTQQNYEYAIYEPIFNDSTGLADTVSIHGVDQPSNKYNTNEGGSDSYRQIDYYGTLNYDRTFGVHDISAVAIIYGEQITAPGELQKLSLDHLGVSANYMFNDRYVAEFSAMGIGSRKLAEGNRIELAPSFGLGWIMTEEDFMDNLSFLNYLKVRASYGISKNDWWDNYFLYTTTFRRGGSFRYYNGTHYNGETAYSSVENEIHLQKREDISLGIDASMLDNALFLELGYFRSTSKDNITVMSSTYPEIMGFENYIYSNYNADLTQGIEMGINYTYRTSGDLSATVGSNLLYISPKITQLEEPIYAPVNAELTREGTATDAMWALLDDGLYSESDFNPDGSLVDGLPIPTYGAVQPGDIKYLDQNGDGVVDQNDIRIVGHGVRTQVSAYLDIRYKNFGLYVLGIGEFGDSNYRSGDYFRSFGNIKFSEYALQAYGPDNMDANALHPRLSTNSGGHNDRNSSFWVYTNNSFTLPTVQLTYHFQGKNNMSFLKPSRAYIRGGNLLILGKNKEYTEVNPSGSPRVRSIVVGVVTSF